MEGYLAHKWGLAGNLPSDHPYKTAAPTVDVSPLVHWRLDETTGTTFANSGTLGSAANAALSGVATKGVASLPVDGGKAVRVHNASISTTAAQLAGTSGNIAYQARTVEGWFRVDSVSGRQGLYMEGDSNRGAAIYLQGNSLTMVAYNRSTDGSGTPWGENGGSGQEPRSISCAEPIRPGVTYHVALVIDGNPAETGALTGYLNGVPFGTTDGVGPSYGPRPVTLGRVNGVRDATGTVTADSPLVGTLDDVRIWDAALPADYFADVYRTQWGLVGHWKFDETSGTTAYDSSGLGNHGNLVGPVTREGVGARSGAYRFSSGTEHVYVPASRTLNVIGADNGDFSLAMWVKPHGSTGSWRPLFKRGLRSSSGYSRHPALWLQPGSNAIHYRVGTTSNSNAGGDSSVQIAWTTWSHVAAVKQGQAYRCYLNGVLNSSVTLPGATVATDVPIFIGDNPYYPGPNTSIDDVRVYTRALSDQEVAALATAEQREPGLLATWYNQPSGYYTNLNHLNWSTPTSSEVVPQINHFGTALERGQAERFGVRFEGYVTVPADGTWTFYVGSDDGSELYVNDVLVVNNNYHQGHTERGGAIALTAGTYPFLVRYYENGGYNSVNASWAGPGVSKQLIPPSAFSHAAQPRSCFAHWPLDESSGTTAYDASGNGRHGTYVAVQLADEAPHPAAGAAPRFDGVTSYVNLGTVNASFAQGFSLALWAKPTSPASNERLLELASDAAGTNRIRLQRNGAAGELAFGLQNPGDSVRIISASNALETQRWQHYVATIRADGHAVLYVNGQPVASGALALPASVSRAVCHLGAAAAQTNKFAGNLADFRLYNYPLAHDEVADLYGLVGWYRCEESSGSVAADSSGKENHAAVVGSAQWSAGLKEGSGALRLDGASYLRVDSIPLGGPHAAIAGWAKLESVDGLGADLANLGEHLVLRLDETTNGRGTTALGYSGAGYGMASSQRFYEAAGWRHYAAVLDGSNGQVTLYLDGVKRGTAPAATGLTFRELVNRVTFGAATNGASDYRLQGWVDDLRIYSRPLSTQEIRTLYFGRFAPGPRIIEWREVP